MTTRSLRRFALALVLVTAPTLRASAADLEFLMSLFQNSPGVDGLDGAEQVVVSADGRFAYVASDNQAGPMGETGGVGIFDLDETAGTIAPNAVVTVEGAHALALSPGPTNQNLYVASETQDQIVWFARDQATGLLTFMDSITGTPGVGVGIDQAWSVAVSNDGLHVYVAGRQDHSIAAFDRTGDGTLTHAETVFDPTGMTNPHEVRVTHDGTQVLVSTEGDDANLGVAFDRIVTDPLVTAAVPIPAPLPLRGVSKTLVVSPDDTSVYFGAQTASSQSPSIAVFDRDPMTNALTPGTLVDDPDLLTVTSMAVSPDGRSLVAVADSPVGGSIGRLQTYSRALNGALTYVETIEHFGFVALRAGTSVAITESGDHTLSLAKGIPDRAMNLFAPEPATGTLALGALGALYSLAGWRGRRRNA